jgi:hypothetical protein
MSKTWGEVANELLRCKTRGEAEQWLAEEVQRMATEYKITPSTAETNLRDSLGYFMGYYDSETAERMQKLLNLRHPFLPWIGKRPTMAGDAEKALEIGKEIGQKLKRNLAD